MLKKIWYWLWRGIALLMVLVLAYEAWFFVQVWWYVDHNPGTTAFMERRLALLGFSWAEAVSTQVYTVQNIGHLAGEVFAARGAARGGLVWYYARPPVIGLEFEMDVRGAARELVL